MRIKYDFEILEKINSGMVISNAAFKIGEKALLSMLYEVSTSPSPGLVSPFSTGAHRDMDFFTFLRSTASIADVMYICAQIGIDYEDGILEKVRCAGIWGEERMLKATEGVNTQKGILFLLGIISAAAGRCTASGEKLNRYNISNHCSKITQGIVKRELFSLDEKEVLTNGEKLFLRYGVTGIRGEIENGLPSILNSGLPFLEDAKKSKLSLNDSLAHALIGLMAEAEDTTVINRCGMDGYSFMQKTAAEAISLGGMKTLEGRSFIKNMENIFIQKNISPGGAADLLAAAVMLQELEN